VHPRTPARWPCTACHAARGTSTYGSIPIPTPIPPTPRTCGASSPAPGRRSTASASCSTTCGVRHRHPGRAGAEPDRSAHVDQRRPGLQSLDFSRLEIRGHPVLIEAPGPGGCLPGMYPPGVLRVRVFLADSISGRIRPQGVRRADRSPPRTDEWAARRRAQPGRGHRAPDDRRADRPPSIYCVCTRP
jgi:hypothetical protein